PVEFFSEASGVLRDAGEVDQIGGLRLLEFVDELRGVRQRHRGSFLGSGGRLSRSSQEGTHATAGTTVDHIVKLRQDEHFFRERREKRVWGLADEVRSDAFAQFRRADEGEASERERSLG